MVTLEVVKVIQVRYRITWPIYFIQAKIMEWDDELMIKGDDGEERRMAAKTSNLNDELALVISMNFQWIF